MALRENFRKKNYSNEKRKVQTLSRKQFLEENKPKKSITTLA
jgi:hypothetical protein